jgi:hypothetical protein
LVAVLVLAGLVLGCGSSSSQKWTKAGATEEQTGKDTLDCLRESSMTAASPQGPVQKVDQTRYRQCMLDRGYTSGPSK